jgi:hypothetical protein
MKQVEQIKQKLPKVHHQIYYNLYLNDMKKHYVQDNELLQLLMMNY